MYIIFYIRHTQIFNEYTKFYTFNVYNFSMNILNFVDSKYTDLQRIHNSVTVM